MVVRHKEGCRGVVKVECPNCKVRVRVRVDGTLVEHVTGFNAPCRLGVRLDEWEKKRERDPRAVGAYECPRCGEAYNLDGCGCEVEWN